MAALLLLLPAIVWGAWRDLAGEAPPEPVTVAAGFAVAGFFIWAALTSKRPELLCSVCGADAEPASERSDQFGKPWSAEGRKATSVPGVTRPTDGTKP